MCGILAVKGTYRYNTIPDSLRERGRDDEGVYSDNCVQLIQTRLHITGEKITLPFQTDRYVLLYNGQIYNWQDVNRELAINTKSDFETVLYAYERWGLDFCDKFNGQFAILIYDKQTQDIQTFFDDLRIKALYKMRYQESDIWSSNLRSLPELKFSNIQLKGYGNVSTAELL